MKKDIFSIILCICLAIGLVPMMAFDTKAADVWDGSIATGYAGGDGTQENPYQIATAAQLAYLSKLCADRNNDDVKDKCWELTADIDLNGIDWTPIGSMFTTYATGAFKGNGHTISGLSIKKECNISQFSSYGLFGIFEGEFSDLTVAGDMEFKDSTNYMEATWVGGICGLAAADINNCRSEVNITVEVQMNASSIGGIIGECQKGILQNSIYTGNLCSTSEVESGEKTIGGITGSLYLGTVNSCKNVGTIIAAYGHVGGVVGHAYTGGHSGKTVIANCVNEGKVEVSRGGQIGGIAGYVSAVQLNGEAAETHVVNCLNLGSVTYSGTNAADFQYVQIGPVYGRSTWTETNTQSKVVLDNCYYVNGVAINSAATGSVTVTENENVVQKSAEEIKTEEFLDLIANNDNYENSTDFWTQGSDGTVCPAFEVAVYTKVKEALAKVPEDLTLYSDACVEALDAAVNAVQYGMPRTEQATVDGYAAAIEAAVAALEYKEADYSKVDEAIAKVNALNKDDYKDFSNVETAVNAVVRGKNITEQAEVDAMASAIEQAIANLEKKPEPKPVDTSEPSKTKERTQKMGASTPQTGDDNNMILWIVTLFVAGGALTGVTILNQKRKYR